MATAKAVSAGNSGKQEDVIVAANMGRKAISDMLTVCKVIFFYKIHPFCRIALFVLYLVYLGLQLHC